MDDPAEFVGWFKDEKRPSEQFRLLRDGFDAVLATVSMYRQRDIAKQEIQNYHQGLKNMARWREEQEAAAREAAAATEAEAGVLN